MFDVSGSAARYRHDRTVVNDNDVIDRVKRWLDTFVIGLNLCPFAHRERVRDAIRFVVTDVDEPRLLLRVLGDELDYLTAHPETETTLLIHPRVLTTFYTPDTVSSKHDAISDARNPESSTRLASRCGNHNGEFLDYNQFLDPADALIESTGLDGIYQIASFHPEYQFANTGADDVENYTNRSPFPMLHILRESSITRALRQHGDPDGITDRNIRVLRNLGLETVRRLSVSAL